jgi:hypothetical protein
MAEQIPSPSPRASFLLIVGILVMIAIPAALTLHTARIAPAIDSSAQNVTPYGYTISLLLFIVPILAISIWFLPNAGVHISRKSFWRTIGILFPLGVILDFFFARFFFKFPNPNATLRIKAPAMGGGVPVEEYVFYFTGFIAVLLIYIWLDEYLLAAYSTPQVWRASRGSRACCAFIRVVLFGIALIGGAILFRHFAIDTPGLPGYFIFLVIGALGPSAMLFPSALPVINWRALGLTFFLILLISLLWEATLALPYGWWGFRDEQMVGIYITAWSRLPIEEVCLWCAVACDCYRVRQCVDGGHRASGRGMRFWGIPSNGGDEHANQV